ncbi:MAG: hypothetical protein FWC26_08075 [Fibromonadales bacterium]|nr:hypothetical protein [Fibromonadales bacterium]
MKTLTISQTRPLWVTSDWHLFHENILKHDKRPFSTVEEMNQKIFENLSIIQAGSILLYGGDFVWGKKEMKYNFACEAKKKIEDMGIEVKFFRGNHDNSLAKYGFVFENNAVDEGVIIEYGDLKFFFVHKLTINSVVKYSQKGIHYFFHGHNHGNKHRDEEKELYDPLNFSETLLKECNGVMPMVCDVSCNIWDYKAVRVLDLLKISSAFHNSAFSKDV